MDDLKQIKRNEEKTERILFKSRGTINTVKISSIITPSLHVNISNNTVQNLSVFFDRELSMKSFITKTVQGYSFLELDLFWTLTS